MRAADGEAARPDEHRGVRGSLPGSVSFPSFFGCTKKEGRRRHVPLNRDAAGKENGLPRHQCAHLLQVLGDEGALELVYAVQVTEGSAAGV